MKNVTLTLAALILFSIPLAAREAQAVSASRVVQNFMCPCGSCTEALATCECPESDRYRGQLFGLIRRGLSEPEIISDFVSRFGSGVLVANAATASSTGGGITLSRESIGILLLLIAVSMAVYAWSRYFSFTPQPAGHRGRKRTRRGGEDVGKRPISVTHEDRRQGGRSRTDRDRELDDLMD